MLLILKLIFKKRKNIALLIATLFSLLLYSLASSTEMFAFSVMVKKGPEAAASFVQAPMQGIQQALNSAGSLAAKAPNLIDNLTNWIDQKLDLGHSVRNLILLLIVVTLFKASTMFLERMFVRLVAIKISTQLREEYFLHLQKMPMAFYQKYNVGSLSTRAVSDSSTIAESINSLCTNWLQTPFILLSTAFLCWKTSPELSLVIFVGCPLFIYPIAYLSKHVKRIAKKMQITQESFAAVLIDFLNGIQTIKMFGMEQFSIKKYHEQNERMVDLQVRASRYDVASRPLIHTVAIFFIVATISYGVYVLQMEISDLFFFCGMLHLFYEPIKKFAENNNTIQRGLAAAERMNDVLQIQPPPIDERATKTLTRFEKEITFKDVWFRYSEDGPWVLKGLNLTVRKGETIAIVGPTGAGKSSLVQLLPRLYDIEKGQILVDGTPIEEFTRQSMREMISFVAQKPFLFLDSIAENISFGTPYTQERLERAAKKARASEFIERLPKGYQTVLSEGGKNLSGGQQQRLAVARALFKEAPILILDEATSSLDNISEQKIKEALHELRGSLTQIIIAHRLSTIADADRILYLDKGELIAEGPLEKLLEACPEFNLMWRLRNGAVVDDLKDDVLVGQT